MSTWRTNQKQFWGVFQPTVDSTWSRSSFLVKSYPFLMSKDRAENPNSWAATENLGGLNTSATKSRFPWWKDAWDNSLACAFSWRRWRTGMHSVSQVFSWGRNQRSVWVLPVLLGIRVMYSRLSFLGFIVYGLVKDYLLSVKVCDNSADDLMPIWSLLTTKRSPSKFDIHTRPHTNPRRNLSWDGLGQDFRLGCTGIDSIREMLGFRWFSRWRLRCS